MKKIPTRKIDIEFHDEIVWGNLVIMESVDKIIANRKEPSRYCDRCGQSWFVHNDDGSCVED